MSSGEKTWHLPPPGRAGLVVALVVIYSLFYHYFVSDSQRVTSGPGPGRRERTCLNPTKVFNAVTLSLPTNVFVGLRLTPRYSIPQQRVGASVSLNDVCLRGILQQSTDMLTEFLIINPRQLGLAAALSDPARNELVVLRESCSP